MKAASAYFPPASIEKSLLRSIAHYSDIAEEEMTVLYTTSPEIPYDTLKSEFACRFIQDSTFLNDVRNIVEGTKNDYVFFMVDDLIYREEFSLRRIETFLDENPDIDCVTPALGRNITGLGRRARDLQQPEFSIRDGEFLGTPPPASVWCGTTSGGKPATFTGRTSS